MHRNRKDLFLVGLLALALATPVVAGLNPLSKKSVQKRKEGGAYDLSKDAASQAREYVKSSKLEGLEGVKRVVIPVFQIEFAVENKTSAVGSGASVKASARLSGVDHPVFEQITNQFYDKVVADLRGLGLEVIPYGTLEHNESYKSMERIFKTSPQLIKTGDGQSLFYSPAGVPIYFGGNLANNDRLGLGATLGNFSTVQPQNIEPGIAKALDAAVLRVRVSVDIAKQHSSGSLMGHSASADTKAQLGLMADFTEFVFIIPGGGRTRIWLGKYINAAEPVLELVKGARSNIDLSAFGGGASTNAKYALVTTPEDYTRVVNEHLGVMEAMFLSVIQPSL
jgi:hypothetical protein